MFDWKRFRFWIHCNSWSNLMQEIQIPGGSNSIHAYSNWIIHVCKWLLLLSWITCHSRHRVLYCDTQHCSAHTNAVSERSTQGECSPTWALILYLTRSCPMNSNISQSPCSSESQTWALSQTQSLTHALQVTTPVLPQHVKVLIEQYLLGQHVHGQHMVNICQHNTGSEAAMADKSLHFDYILIVYTLSSGGPIHVYPEICT